MKSDIFLNIHVPGSTKIGKKWSLIFSWKFMYLGLQILPKSEVWYFFENSCTQVYKYWQKVKFDIFVVPARPVLNFCCPGPSRPLAKFLACPVVPLSRDNEGTSVPLSQKVSLSCPVGNPNFHPSRQALSSHLCQQMVWLWRWQDRDSIQYSQKS